MANYDIEINYYNGSSYSLLYPKTQVTNIVDGFYTYENSYIGTGVVDTSSLFPSVKLTVSSTITNTASCIMFLHSAPLIGISGAGSANQNFKVTNNVIFLPGTPSDNNVYLTAPGASLTVKSSTTYLGISLGINCIY